MKAIDINEKNKTEFNKIVNHPLQSYEWGEFRKKTGVKVVRKGFLEKDMLTFGFQLTIHKIPYTSFTIGYLPKCSLPTKEIIDELKKISMQEKCIFIQIEPNTEMENGSDNWRNTMKNLGLMPSFHPLFTRYTFELDLTKSEDELIKNMHSKTRYNIKVAKKHNVQITKDSLNQAFLTYINLTKETTKRQRFYAHTEKYHSLMWETLGIQNSNLEIEKLDRNGLSAHLFTANYHPPSTTTPITLAAWILFVFHDTLYYPYGSSANLYRETMASNLMMWEAIRFGKKLGLKKFDMWGALGPNPNKNDPWYGFHRFKEGYGGRLTEFAGSFDLISKPFYYQIYKSLDKTRWLLLKLQNVLS